MGNKEDHHSPAISDWEESHYCHYNRLELIKSFNRNTSKSSN
jgi:hypothetical protein